MKNGFHVFSRISTQQNPLHWLGLFLCMLLFAASSAWATGGTMSGSGTLRDPYIISDAADWRAFARAVYLNGNTYENKYIKLGADITVTQKVGDYTDGMPFSGTFNGDGHTITADISQTSQNPFSTDPFRSQNINGAALFSYIKGAPSRTSPWQAASPAESIRRVLWAMPMGPRWLTMSRVKALWSLAKATKS